MSVYVLVRRCVRVRDMRCSINGRMRFHSEPMQSCICAFLFREQFRLINYLARGHCLRSSGIFSLLQASFGKYPICCAQRLRNIESNAIKPGLRNCDHVGFAFDFLVEQLPKHTTIPLHYTLCDVFAIPYYHVPDSVFGSQTSHPPWSSLLPSLLYNTNWNHRRKNNNKLQQ